MNLLLKTHFYLLLGNILVIFNFITTPMVFLFLRIRKLWLTGFYQAPAAGEWKNLNASGDLWLQNPGNMVVGLSRCQ